MLALTFFMCYSTDEISSKLVDGENGNDAYSRTSYLESARSSLRDRTLIACSKTDKTSSPMCIACTEKLHHKGNSEIDK